MAELRTQAVVELVDRFTRPMRQVNQTMDRLKQNAGFNRLASQGRALSSSLGTATDRAGRLAGRSIEPASWTVDSLSIWAAEYDEPVRRLSLPF